MRVVAGRRTKIHLCRLPSRIPTATTAATGIRQTLPINIQVPNRDSTVTHSTDRAVTSISIRTGSTRKAGTVVTISGEDTGVGTAIRFLFSVWAVCVRLH